MSDEHESMHFGLNCRFLKRDKYLPADGRCTAAIERYAAQKFSFLDTKTAVPLEEAARFLGLPKPEVVRQAKAGDLEYSYPDNVSKRVTLHTNNGPREFTVTEAAKKLKVSVADLEEQIQRGAIEAFYPDEFMHIVLVNRWEYEKCPLIDAGGQCCDFRPHGGPYIRCIAEAARLAEGSP